jgi:hypothetical protein
LIHEEFHQVLLIRTHPAADRFTGFDHWAYWAQENAKLRAEFDE